MEVTKPNEFIGFGAMEVTKPYEIIGFGAVEVTKPYEFIRFGAVDRPKVRGRGGGPTGAPPSRSWRMGPSVSGALSFCEGRVGPVPPACHP